MLIVFISAVPDINSQCFERVFAFREGEKLEYEIYYNLGPVWLNAGYVRFEVKPKAYQGRNVYHLDGYGASYKGYDWIFKVRNRYQSYIDKESLKPLWFRSVTSEGGLEGDNICIFEHQGNRIFSDTWNTERVLQKDTIPVKPCTFDLISIIYLVRNMNFAGLKTGDSVAIRTFINNESQDLFIRYMGKENINNRDHKRYRCIKLSVFLGEGTIFKSGEDLTVWLTNDKNRMPVLIEARIRVGSIKIFLKSAKGLRNPQSALLEPK
jgi:hypothetical protein